MSWEQVIFILGGCLVVAIFCRVVSCLIEIRREWWRRILLFLGSYLLIYMIIFIGDWDNLPPTLLCFLCGIWIACRGSRWKRLTIGLMLASTMFAVSALFDNCVTNMLDENPGDSFVSYFIFRALAVLLLYIGVYRHRPESDFELAPSLWRLLLVLCIPPAGIVCVLVLFSDAYYRDSGYSILMNAALFLIAASALVGNLWAMLIFNRQQKLERENALAEYNRKYYEAMEEQQFEIRRIRHDLANHLQVLLSLPAAEKDSYIQKMLENPAFEKVLSYSGDATVNAVLTAKESLMRQRGISFHAKVDISRELSFEKPDLCALFANALDNAVEACATLEAGKRQVELTARAAKGILAVEVKNPFEGEFSNGLPRTTKHDAQNHGYGLRSIQDIVKKYGGNMEIRQENGQFCLFLFMHSPIQRKYAAKAAHVAHGE